MTAEDGDCECTNVFAHEIGSEGTRIALVTRLGSDEVNGPLSRRLQITSEGSSMGRIQVSNSVAGINCSPSRDASDDNTASGDFLSARVRMAGIRQLGTNRMDEMIETTRTAYYRVEIGASSTHLRGTTPGLSL